MPHQSPMVNKPDYQQALTRLFWLRNIILATQLTMLILVTWGLDIAFHTLPLLIVIALLAIINLLLFGRLKQSWQVSKLEIALNLTLDTLSLAALLYFTGGSTNPLVSLFIIPVALSAVFLPISYIIWFVSLTVFLYSLLMKNYVALPSIGSRFGGDFNLHILGMYGNFIFSAIIVAIFIYALARTNRRHEQHLARAKEKLIRNQHVVETALLAANAAHEISTPLSTISLLAEELLAEIEQPSTSNRVDLIDDVTEIKKQVLYCKKRLEILQQKALFVEEDEKSVNLREGLIDTIENWKVLHPQFTVEQHIQLDNKILFPSLNNLKVTLVNLMDNAADASLKTKQFCIKLSIKTLKTQLIIDVDDFGEGLSEQQLTLIGKRPYSSKPEGLGIGLLLSHTSLDHIGGHILLNNHKKNDHTTGIRARITVPLASSRS